MESMVEVKPSEMVGIVGFFGASDKFWRDRNRGKEGQ